MAKEKKELLKELKGGVASTTFVGAAVVRDNSLKGIQQKEGKTWRHVDSSFGIKTGEGNTIFVRVWGGYKQDNPILKRWDTENNLVDIKWENRLKEDVIKSVRPSELFKAGFEKSEDGKLIIKEFISEIDFEEYLREHLADGMEIKVRAEARYQEYNDDIQRQYNIKSVYLNLPYEKEGETIVTPNDAKIRQTYVIDEDALDRKWERTLEKEGSIVIQAFVPQYLSQIKTGDKYIEFKKTVPLAQGIIFKMKDKEDKAELASKKKIIERFFKVKKGVVREITLINRINEGFEESTGVEVNDEMRELIEMGVFTEEDIKKQVTIRGNKVSELVFFQPAVSRDKETNDVIIQMDDEKYAPEALIVPTIDGDDDDDDESFEKEGTAISDDEFTSLFG